MHSEMQKRDCSHKTELRLSIKNIDDINTMIPPFKVSLGSSDFEHQTEENFKWVKCNADY